MADITIYLKYENDDLYYKTGSMTDFQPMTEKTIIGADKNQTMAWTCDFEGSNIDKIVSITSVAEKDGKRTTDIWADNKKPREKNSSKRTFEATVGPDGYSKENPAYYMYDIKYKPTGGRQDKDKDPGTRVPPENGED